MFPYDLTKNVTRYSQQDSKWCGPAVIEMVRNGYPNPADRLFYSQADLWGTIQSNNSALPADLTHWDTDPRGLTVCLQSLGNPSGVNWLALAGVNRVSVLFSTIYAMKVGQYPVPVLINNGQHWVILVAYQTDIEPVSGGSATLQSITYYDPWPQGVGAVTTQAGYQWFDGPWKYSIIYPGSWYQRFVAVIEQPSGMKTVKGTVRVDRVKRTRRKLLSPSEAVAHVQRWIAERKFGERPEYSLLARADTDNLEPAIVLEELSGNRSKNSPCYYLVPYGLKTEFSDRGSRLARVCIMLNAYTGEVDEVTAFGTPVQYVTADEALAVVAAALHADPTSLGNAEICLAFKPSDVTRARAFPFWRVAVANRVLYVDQFRQVHNKLFHGMPGN